MSEQDLKELIKIEVKEVLDVRRKGDREIAQVIYEDEPDRPHWIDTKSIINYSLVEDCKVAKLELAGRATSSQAIPPPQGIFVPATSYQVYPKTMSDMPTQQNFEQLNDNLAEEAEQTKKKEKRSYSSKPKVLVQILGMIPDTSNGIQFVAKYSNQESKMIVSSVSLRKNHPHELLAYYEKYLQVIP